MWGRRPNQFQSTLDWRGSKTGGGERAARGGQEAAVHISRTEEELVRAVVHISRTEEEPVQAVVHISRSTEEQLQAVVHELNKVINVFNQYYQSTQSM